MSLPPKYPGIRVVSTGNQLVAYHTEARIADAGIFYPITPSTEMGELFQLSFAEGKLNVFGRPKIAVEAEGEHAAQGGAIAYAATGKRVVNFTSGQGIAYGMEQYYHAPGKLVTMVVEVAARALTMRFSISMSGVSAPSLASRSRTWAWTPSVRPWGSARFRVER